MFDNIGVHLTSENSILTKTPKANPFAHFQMEIFEFDSSRFSEFQCGIKNDAMGPDDDNGHI